MASVINGVELNTWWGFFRILFFYIEFLSFLFFLWIQLIHTYVDSLGAPSLFVWLSVLWSKDHPDFFFGKESVYIHTTWILIIFLDQFCNLNFLFRIHWHHFYNFIQDHILSINLTFIINKKVYRINFKVIVSSLSSQISANRYRDYILDFDLSFGSGKRRGDKWMSLSFILKFWSYDWDWKWMSRCLM